MNRNENASLFFLMIHFRDFVFRYENTINYEESRLKKKKNVCASIQDHNFGFISIWFFILFVFFFFCEYGDRVLNS